MDMTIVSPAVSINPSPAIASVDAPIVIGLYYPVLGSTNSEPIPF